VLIERLLNLHVHDREKQCTLGQSKFIDTSITLDEFGGTAALKSLTDCRKP
jgi:hypothetical protein